MKGPRREGIPWLPGNQGSGKDVLRVWASRRLHPASPGSALLTEDNEMTGLQPGPCEPSRRWNNDQPIGASLGASTQDTAFTRYLGGC